MKTLLTSAFALPRQLVRTGLLGLAVAVLSLLLLTGATRPARAAPPTWFGVNLPWISYGADFGMDFYYSGYGPTYNASTMESYLADIQSKHMNIIRVFTMEDFSGLSFQGGNADNPCTGVSQVFINNLVDFCRRANNHGITVYVTFLNNSDVQKHPNIVIQNRGSFIQNALVPVATALKPYQVRYDLMNECNYAGQSWSNLRNYGNDARIALHKISGHPVTMSTDYAGAFGSNFYNTLGGLGFDFYDCHHYTTSTSPISVTRSMAGNAPLFIGEYGPDPGKGWDQYTAAQDQSYIDNFCGAANANNYTGMLAWSYAPGNTFSLRGTNTLWNIDYYGNQWGIN